MARITVEALAAEIGVEADNPRLPRLLASYDAVVTRQLQRTVNVPDEIAAECVVLLAAYAFDRQIAGGTQWANAFVNSGASALLAPYRIIDGTVVGNEPAAGPVPAGTTGGPGVDQTARDAAAAADAKAEGNTAALAGKQDNLPALGDHQVWTGSGGRVIAAAVQGGEAGVDQTARDAAASANMAAAEAEKNSAAAAMTAGENKAFLATFMARVSTIVKAIVPAWALAPNPPASGGGTNLPAFEQAATQGLFSRAGALFWRTVSEVPSTPGEASAIGEVLRVTGENDRDYAWGKLSGLLSLSNRGGLAFNSDGELHTVPSLVVTAAAVDTVEADIVTLGGSISAAQRTAGEAKVDAAAAKVSAATNKADIATNKAAIAVNAGLIETKPDGFFEIDPPYWVNKAGGGTTATAAGTRTFNVVLHTPLPQGAHDLRLNIGGQGVVVALVAGQVVYDVVMPNAGVDNINQNLRGAGTVRANIWIRDNAAKVLQSFGVELLVVAEIPTEPLSVDVAALAVRIKALEDIPSGGAAAAWVLTGLATAVANGQPAFSARQRTAVKKLLTDRKEIMVRVFKTATPLQVYETPVSISKSNYSGESGTLSLMFLLPAEIIFGSRTDKNNRMFRLLITLDASDPPTVGIFPWTGANPTEALTYQIWGR